MKITLEKFGELPDGRQVDLYTLENLNGVKVQISNYGAVIRRILVPDRNGAVADVVLGYKTFEEYINNPEYFGALVGRSTNLMAGNIVEISGKEYVLDKNYGENNLHGGFHSLTYRLFGAETRTGEATLVLSHTVTHLSDGFPGNLKVTVTYTLTDDNALKIRYHAVSDADTVISFSNHTHFNLGGHASGAMYDHILDIPADFYSPIDTECIPTGEILKVTGTPFDFRGGKRIGDYIFTDCEQLNIYGGYDHNFVVKGKGFRRAATLTHAASGRELEVFTDLPGVHLYTCNLLSEGEYKDGGKYRKHQAMCFETQIFPNAVNMPWVLSPIHKAGEEYSTATTFRFAIKDK